MKITRITEQVKQKGRYSIYVDGAYAFSVSETLLLEARLIPGQELTAQELSDWKHQSAEDKLYMQALRYAAMRLRSRWEMAMYLQRKEASPPLADSILNKLSNLKLIDDESYARAFIANRHLLRPSSKRKLQQELRAKHVSDEVIGRVMAADDTDEQSTLLAVVAKKRQLSKYQNDPQKFMQYLARQGFSYEDIKAALGHLDEE